VRLYLDLDSAAVNERHEWNYELCDDDLTTTGVDKYYSSTSNLMIAFHSDKFASNHTGFRAFYRFLDKRQCSALLVLANIHHQYLNRLLQDSKHGSKYVFLGGGWLSGNALAAITKLLYAGPV